MWKMVKQRLGVPDTLQDGLWKFNVWLLSEVKTTMLEVAFCF
jgi:hypothetical protein